MTEAEKQMLVSEVNLLRELRHPNIVRYYDRIIDRSSTTLYIVMEYCDGGDLASLIAKCTKERQVKSVCTSRGVSWEIKSATCLFFLLDQIILLKCERLCVKNSEGKLH